MFTRSKYHPCIIGSLLGKEILKLHLRCFFIYWVSPAFPKLCRASFALKLTSPNNCKKCYSTLRLESDQILDFDSSFPPFPKITQFKLPAPDHKCQ